MVYIKIVIKKQQHSIGENKIFVEHTIPDERSFEYPLIFVHGSFGGYFMWDMFVEYFAGKGFECYALSLRGHKPSGGEESLGQLTMQDYVKDVQGVVLELEIENPLPVGHSMGGLVVLMYTAQYKPPAAVVLGPSETKEVHEESSEGEINKIPDVYTVMDAGMPIDPARAMKALPDISQETLIKMKDMFGLESGSARRDRKRGISIHKEQITSPLFILGSGLGDSVKFGISGKSSKKMANYYKVEYYEVKNATHPGIIMGKYGGEAMEKIES